MADTWDLSTYAGRQAARDAGNWVGADSGGNVVLEAGHPGGQANVTSSPASIGGSLGGGGALPGTGGQQDILDAFKASSGFSQQQLAEQTRQFNESLAFQKQQWEQAGLPTAQVNIKVQEATIQQIMNQIQMAQANLGLGYLSQAAQLGGPADYFQQSNFFRGAQGQPGVPTFLSALQNGLTMPAFGATGSTAPIAQNMDTLAQQLNGGATPGLTNTPASAVAPAAGVDQMRQMSAAPAANPTTAATAITGTPVNQAIAGVQSPTQQNAALGLIGAIGRTGGTGLAPQAIEQLTPDELALFGSGLKASGFSLPSFLQSYQQSRVGQRAAVPLG